MKRRVSALAIIVWLLTGCNATHSTALKAVVPETVGMSSDALARIDGAVTREVSHGTLPGAAVEIVHRGAIVYRKAFGARALYPKYEPNTIDTIYDLASMTKPIATATAIMKLVEEGKIRLWDRAAYYDPPFAAHSKALVTIEELLDHSAGLPSALNEWQSVLPPSAGERIVDEMPLHFAPGSQYEYCNTCFIELAKIVRIVAHSPLPDFAAASLFEPLGLGHSMSLRPDDLSLSNVSPEAEVKPGSYLRGRFVIAGHGAIGAIGHAGLFASADAVAVYAQMLLNNGTYNGVRILGPQTVARMITPQYLGRTTQREGSVRGLGWDEATTDSSNRGELFGMGGYGHTGSTGCSLWIDPASQTAVIFLSNAAHSKRDNDSDIVRLYARVSTLAAAAINEPQAAENESRQAAEWSARVAAQAAGFEHWSALDAKLWQHDHRGTAY